MSLDRVSGSMKSPKYQLEEDKDTPVLSDQPSLHQGSFIVDHLDKHNIPQCQFKGESPAFARDSISPEVRDFYADLFSERRLIPDELTESSIVSKNSTAHEDLSFLHKSLNYSNPNSKRIEMTNDLELYPSSYNNASVPNPQTISLLEGTNLQLKTCDFLTENTSIKATEGLNTDLTSLNVESPNSLSRDLNFRSISRNLEPSPSLQNPEQAFIDLIPMINSSTPKDYCDVLVATLRQCSHQVPLKEFCKLLFRTDLKKISSISRSSEYSQFGEFRNEGFRLCYFIIETFRCPDVPIIPSVVGMLNNPLLSKIKFSEFRRNFLAAKIIYDFAIEVESAPQALFSLEKYSMKLTYVIICKKLFHGSVMTPTANNVLIGQAQLGKLIKLIYPGLTTRRFGKRGNSVYHYVGITWNPLIVNEEVLRLLDVEKEKYKAHLMKMRVEPSMPSRIEQNRTCKEKEHEVLDSRVHLLPSLKPPNQVKYSFVRIDSKYPANCSGRSFEYIPGRPPKNSTWSNDTISKSTAALKEFKFDIKPFIQDFNIIIFSSDNSGKLYSVFAEAMGVLSNQASHEEAYLHFFLVILLLIFPICLASKEEIALTDQEQIRQNLSDFISNIYVHLTNFSGVTSGYLLNFINIIRKMIHLIRLGHSFVKTSSVGNITNEIVRDMKQPTDDPEKLFNIATVTEELMFMSFMKATKAFKYDFFKEISGKRPNDNAASLSNLASAFLKYCEAGAVSVSLIPDFMTPDDLSQAYYDLPFQIFKISLFGLHKFWLAESSTRQLPIPVIIYIAREVGKGLQDVSFKNYDKRTCDLSQETFKSWWVYSTMLEEYLNILSEVAALSEILYNYLAK